MQTGLWSCCFCDLECTSSEVEQGYWGCSGGLKDGSSALPAVVLEPAAAQALLGMPAHAHAGLPSEQQQSLAKVGARHVDGSAAVLWCCAASVCVAMLWCCILDAMALLHSVLLLRGWLSCNGASLAGCHVRHDSLSSAQLDPSNDLPVVLVVTLLLLLSRGTGSVGPMPDAYLPLPCRQWRLASMQSA